MDISNSISFIVGILIALAAGYVGWQDWQKASHEKRLLMVKSVVLAVEEYVKQYPDKVPGVQKLALAMDKLKLLLPQADPEELDVLVHAEVARMNAESASLAQGRGYWTN